jgi:tetratricopeptide (TPR) repeat protein
MPKTKRLKLVKDAELAVAGTKEWRETVPVHLRAPLAKALSAMENNDMANALKWFGECAKIEPFSKPVLYFGGQCASQAYSTLKGENPNSPNLPQWRDIAETLTRAAFQVAPDDAIACHNVGRFLQDTDQDDEAAEFYRHALMLNPKLVETWGNLGTLLYQRGDVALAWEAWERCISLPPRVPSGSLTQSYIHLRKGDYIKGWQAYGERWNDIFFQRSYGRRNDLGPDHWLGGKLPKNHRLLVHGEQGLGDHVQFARYLPVLIEQGYNVVGLETRAVLKRWMEASFPDVPVFVRDGGPLPGFTHHVSSMDLPRILGTTLETIPPPIRPDVGESLWHGMRNGVTPRLSENYCVGIAWEGAKGNPADSLRSIPAEHLGILADIPGVTWVSLQFSPDAALTGRAWLGKNFIDGTEGCSDTLDTAHVMRRCDFIICVDTLTAHMAGTLGMPTWILHRFAREWRFLDAGKDCPWYPTARSLTQSAPGDWPGLLRSVRTELERMANG